MKLNYEDAPPLPEGNSPRPPARTEDGPVSEKQMSEAAAKTDDLS